MIEPTDYLDDCWIYVKAKWTLILGHEIKNKFNLS